MQIEKCRVTANNILHFAFVNSHFAFPESSVPSGDEILIHIECSCGRQAAEVYRLATVAT